MDTPKNMWYIPFHTVRLHIVFTTSSKMSLEEDPALHFQEFPVKAKGILEYHYPIDEKPKRLTFWERNHRVLF